MVEGPTGRELTYSAMKAQIRAVAAGLTARGFKKGDVLAIISPVRIARAPRLPPVCHAQSPPPPLPSLAVFGLFSQ